MPLTTGTAITAPAPSRPPRSPTYPLSTSYTCCTNTAAKFSSGNPEKRNHCGESDSDLDSGLSADVSNRLDEASAHFALNLNLPGLCRSHKQQGYDHCAITHRVAQKRPRRSGERQDHPSESWPDSSGGVELETVHRNRRRKVFDRYQKGDERLPSRNGESTEQARKCSHGNDGARVADSGNPHEPQCQRGDRGPALTDDQQLASLDTVGEIAGQGAQQHRREDCGECGDSSPERLSSYLQQHNRKSDVLEPGTGVRYECTGPEASKILMVKRSEAVPDTAGIWRCCRCGPGSARRVHVFQSMSMPVL